MYDNIGSKIKGLAIGLFIASSIAGFVFGVELLQDCEELFGVAVMIITPIVAYLNSWLIFGLGELVDNSREIAYNTRALREEDSKIKWKDISKMNIDE